MALLNIEVDNYSTIIIYGLVIALLTSFPKSWLLRPGTKTDVGTDTGLL
jgi:hypothetical protein